MKRPLFILSILIGLSGITACKTSQKVAKNTPPPPPNKVEEKSATEKYIATKPVEEMPTPQRPIAETLAKNNAQNTTTSTSTSATATGATATGATATGATATSATSNPSNSVVYFPSVRQIVQSNCIKCHKPQPGVSTSQFLQLDTDEKIIAQAMLIKAAVADPETSTNHRMPKDGRLSASEIDKIVRWFEKGGRDID